MKFNWQKMFSLISLESTLCDEHNVIKIFYENNEKSSVDDIKNFIEEHELTEKDFSNVLNETTVLNSSNTELFIKLAKFIHKCGIKEQVLLNCIHEPFSKNVLDKLPEHAFNQAYLDKDCSGEKSIKSLEREPCLGIFKRHWSCEIFRKLYGIEYLITSNLKFLKHAHENGYVLTIETYLCASKNGNLDCLKYLHKNDCPCDKRVYIRYALYGHLDCLKYFHEIKCSFDEMVFEHAALNGHLDCLKYLYEIKCPWNESACANAAENGHLDCLKYLHDNGCPWDKWTCAHAGFGGHLNCLKYAHENGCPWDEDTCVCSFFNKQFDCLKYARDNGCPWNNLIHQDIFG